MHRGGLIRQRYPHTESRIAPRLSQREMSQRLHCAPSSIVPLIDSLEPRGWVTRRVDSADRRINMLVLTPAGRDLRERLMRQLLGPPAAIRRLSSETQQQLRDVLRALVHELGERPPRNATDAPVTTMEEANRR